MKKFWIPFLILSITIFVFCSTFDIYSTKISRDISKDIESIPILKTELRINLGRDLVIGPVEIEGIGLVKYPYVVSLNHTSSFNLDKVLYRFGIIKWEGKKEAIYTYTLIYEDEKVDLKFLESKGDLVLFKIKGTKDIKNCPFKFADSSKFRVGTNVYILDRPYHVYRGFKTGIISCLKDIEDGSIFDSNKPMAIDSNVNPGDSGSIMLVYNMCKMRYEVAGILCAKYCYFNREMLSVYADGMGYMITINHIKSLLEE